MGYWSYSEDTVPPGRALCRPHFRRPLYSYVGTDDPIYGDESAIARGQGSLDNWEHRLSAEVLRCAGRPIPVPSTAKVWEVYCLTGLTCSC